MINRGELASFLHTRRGRLQPDDVGLPSTGPRRTPGLRRQEVAQLAGMSVDYYIRLEQGRGPHPSKQVLAALTRALMLSIDEREYLFRLAGQDPPPASGPSREVPNAVRLLLDTLTETPAYVVDAKYDLLAWNRMAALFIGATDDAPPEAHNMIRWMFRDDTDDQRWNDANMVSFARASVADLRAAYARYPGDPGIGALVDDLLTTSPRFAAIWANHEVEVRRRIIKRIVHPAVGPLAFECQVLHVPDSDQRLIIYCAEPESDTRRAFQRLAQLPDTAARGRHEVHPQCPHSAAVNGREATPPPGHRALRQG